MLRHLVLHCPFPAGSSAHPGLFPRVTRLTYLGTHFETAVLDRLPALRALEFGEVGTRRAVIENAQAANSLALRHLERLSIRGRKSEPILSWIRRTDCANTLRELEVAVLGGWNAHDLDTFRSVLQSLRGLQKLQLSSDIQMWWVRDAGEFIRAVYENSSWPPNGGASGLAYGQIHTPRLIVELLPDQEALPVLMALLKETTFVGLRQLEVLIDRHVQSPYRRDWPCDDNGPAFDPFKLVRSSAPLDEHGTLGPVLAGQLEEIIISMPRIPTLYQASRFLAAFGEANRPGVLRFHPATVILRDDPLP
jgi:hypothetical protein